MSRVDNPSRLDAAIDRMTRLATTCQGEVEVRVGDDVHETETCGAVATHAAQVRGEARGYCACHRLRRPRSRREYRYEILASDGYWVIRRGAPFCAGLDGPPVADADIFDGPILDLGEACAAIAALAKQEKTR